MKLIMDDERAVTNPSVDQVRVAVEELNSGVNEFIRLEQGSFIFMQAARGDSEGIVVERRNGKKEVILATKSPIELSKAIRMFQDYLTGAAQWEQTASWVEMSSLPTGAAKAINRVGSKGGVALKNSIKHFGLCALMGTTVALAVAGTSLVASQSKFFHRIDVKAFLVFCSAFPLAACFHSIAEGSFQGRFYTIRRHETPIRFFVTVGIYCGFGIAIALLASFVR